MKKVNLTIIKLSFLLVFPFLFSSLNAQTKPETPTKPINSGVVNGKAVSLPKPIYPPAIGSKPRPTGTVNVQVLIDENGNVISAKAIKGIEDISFRQAAEIAALQAKFMPTTLSGKPAKVSGVIVYNFVDSASNEERLKIFGLSAFLHMLRNSANNLEQLSEAIDSKDMIIETSDEFSAYATEINQLNSIKSLSYEERLTKIDEVTSLIKNKLTTSEKWQFDLGKSFGGIISQFIELKNDDNFDPDKFDESNLKKYLSEIKELTAVAPTDFPPDVLQGLKNLSDESEKGRIFTAENIEVFSGKMEKLLESISPGSTN
jgi:TonB family protein